MGYGLQLWLQVIWFLCGAVDASTVILDEPDVYMHPDLQRRLFKELIGDERKYSQIVITTHSAEMLSQVESASIVEVDKRARKCGPLGGEEEVQDVFDRIGSNHNVHIARLSSVRRLLLVEGNDAYLLREFQKIIERDAFCDIDTIPVVPVEGWSGWPRVKAVSQSIGAATGNTIRVLALFDSDYHPSEAVQERIDEADTAGIFLHIWGRKEIENYCISPEAILRVIERRRRRGADLSVADVRRTIDDICLAMRDSVLDDIAAQLVRTTKNLQAANRRARAVVESVEGTMGTIECLVSGKAVLTKLSAWSKENHGASFSPATVIRAMRGNEIIPEMAHVIRNIGTRTLEARSWKYRGTDYRWRPQPQLAE